MNKKLSVRLYGKQVGILSLVNGKMQFVYDKGVKNAISLSLPLGDNVFNEKICRAYFGGLLPENPNMRKLLAKKFGIHETNDFALLKEIGQDCAGAISFHNLDEAEQEQDFVNITGTVLSDDELYEKIRNLPFKPYMGNRISLAGAQEKTAVCLIDGKIALPDENVPTTHIIKTVLPGYEASVQNEYICMKAAKLIGLDTADVEIYNVKDIEFLMIERFDRIVSGKNSLSIKRVLQEDFAQALGVAARDKYDVSIVDCLQVLMQMSSPVLAKMEFIRRVIFNTLIGNTDAHAKNFSLYLANDELKSRLTPAYDILCSGLYDCDQRLAMKIGKAKYIAEITTNDWQIFAEQMDVSYKFVEEELACQKLLLPKILNDLADETKFKIAFTILDFVKDTCKN